MSFFNCSSRVTLGLVAVALSHAGLDFVNSSNRGAGAALGNMRPGLGKISAPAGNFSSLKRYGKWILTACDAGRTGWNYGVLRYSDIKFWREHNEAIHKPVPWGPPECLIARPAVEVIFGIPGLHNQEM